MRAKQKYYPGVHDSEYGNARRIHIIMAEKVLGVSRLPKGVQVHHVNENTTDYTPTNLVICPNSAYHKLLHRRTEALDSCGNANWLKCCFCKNHDAPENMKSRNRVINGSNWAMHYHVSCRTKTRTKQRQNTTKMVA